MAGTVGRRGPAGLALPATHPSRDVLPPRPMAQKNARLVEGCFCPEGTMNYAPGFDVCVEMCGMAPALLARRSPRVLRRWAPLTDLCSPPPQAAWDLMTCPERSALPPGAGRDSPTHPESGGLGRVAHRNLGVSNPASCRSSPGRLSLQGCPLAAPWVPPHLPPCLSVPPPPSTHPHRHAATLSPSVRPTVHPPSGVRHSVQIQHDILAVLSVSSTCAGSLVLAHEPHTHVWRFAACQARGGKC